MVRGYLWGGIQGGAGGRRSDDWEKSVFCDGRRQSFSSLD